MDMVRLREALSNRIGGMASAWLEGKSVDECVASLTEMVQEECKACSKPLHNNLRAVPWWFPELTVERKKVLAARRRYQRCSCPDTRPKYKLDFKKIQAKFRRSVRRAKWKFFGSILRDVDPKKPFGPHFAWVKGKFNSRLKLNLIRTGDGTTTHDFNSSIKALLEYHFPLDSMPASVDGEVRTTHTEDDPEISYKELETAIRSLNKGRAPGLDGLPIEIIIVLYEVNKELFLGLMNKCLNEGKFPTAWKTGQLVLFNKPGKDGREPGSYRPICLLPAWSKVLDKIITDRIYYHFNRSGKMDNCQFGFIPGRGTVDAINKLKSIIDTNQAHDTDTCVIMLDVKSAFNNLRWPAVINALHSINCPKNLIKMVDSFLSDRKIIYQTELSVQEHSYNLGCPQGSNSGPLYWILVANSIFDLDLGEHVRVIAYADDFAVTVSAPNAHICARRANKALEAINSWANLLGLKFSAEKTFALFFRKLYRPGLYRNKPNKHMPKTPPRISFNGVSVKFRQHIRYLGVILDTNSNGLAHVEYLRGQVAKYVVAIQSLSRRDWGLSGDVLKGLYKGGIERMVAYACGSWWTGSVRMRAKLLSIQRLVLLSITKCYRTTSSSALQVLAGTLPLDLQVEMESSISRLARNNNTLRFGNLEFEPNIIQRSINRFEHHPAKAPYISWEPRLPNGEGVELFTDGSKMDGRVGSGAVLYEGGSLAEKWSVRLNDDATVFQAELKAIITALRNLDGLVDKGVTTKIYTDSMSSLHALARAGHLDPMVNEIHALRAGRKIEWYWVKAHIGTAGNEAADSQAKIGSKKEEIDSHVKLSLKCVKTRVKKEAIKIWQTRWDSDYRGRNVHKHLHKVSLTRAWTSPRLNWLITGHGPFPSYYVVFGLRNTNNCNFCDSDVPEDGEHLVTSCPGTLSARTRICPNLSSSTIHKYYVLQEGRAALDKLLLNLNLSNL